LGIVDVSPCELASEPLTRLLAGLVPVEDEDEAGCGSYAEKADDRPPDLGARRDQLGRIRRAGLSIDVGLDYLGNRGDRIEHGNGRGETQQRQLLSDPVDHPVELPLPS
jgi:hypothetical protein